MLSIFSKCSGFSRDIAAKKASHVELFGVGENDIFSSIFHLAFCGFYVSLPNLSWYVRTVRAYHNAKIYSFCENTNKMMK